MVAAKKSEGEGDDFKNTLAAMLARGQGGRQQTLQPKKAEPIEEVKEKIKLNVFEDDDGDEEAKVLKMIERQQNLAAEETEAKMGIMALEKPRRASKKMMTFDSDDDE